MRFNLNQIEKEMFESLFKQHELNIDYFLQIANILLENSAILSPNQIESIKGKEPFDKRKIFFEQLFLKHPPKNAFINKEMMWDTTLLSTNQLINDPYYVALKNLSFEEDGWSLKKKTIKPYSIFPYQEEYHYGPNFNIKMGLGLFDEEYIYPSLCLYDTEWMSLNPHEIRTMEVPITTAKGKVLTLGLGLGYFAYMAHLKEEVKEIHIVEMDIGLINLFNKYLLPLFPYPNKIHIHKADAFYFVNQIKDKDYDFIFADLWHSTNDGLECYINLLRTFSSFKYTQVHYWIEGAIITFLRTLVIGVIKDEYYAINNEYEDLQKLIKSNLEDLTLNNTYDFDNLLNIRGLKNIVTK